MLVWFSAAQTISIAHVGCRELSGASVMRN